MNKIYKAVIKTKTHYLVHYNHNHDKLGRFAKSNGSSGSSGMKELDPNSKEGKAFIREVNRAVAKDKIRKAYRSLKFGGPSDLLYGSILKNDQKKKDNQAKAELSEDEKKNVVLDNDISKFSKNHQLKSIKGDVFVDHGYSYLDQKHDYNVVGESSSKVWKEEVKTKGGVHIIETHPTRIDFGDVAHSSGVGIDKNKVKALDQFARSKENNKAIYAGRDFVAKDMESRTTKLGKGDKNYKQDVSPVYISYGFNDKGEPVIKNATFVDKKHRFDYEDSGRRWRGEFFVKYENGKPYEIDLSNDEIY